MSKDEEKTRLLAEKRDSYKQKLSNEESLNFSWSAVSKASNLSPKKDFVGSAPTVNNVFDNFLSSKIDFVGKNLEGGKFAKENLEGANFSVANLTGVDFSGANLKNADFSGANLTGANLEGANLDGAVLSGSQLVSANLTGASLKGVKLVDADIENAILLGIEIDSITLEELQHLIEYLAKYYPHKLDLTRINLTMLNLAQIDLRNVNLRGVDFTGCDFTGVNIFELDLSECIITPEQIAQALGRVPTKDEMAKLLAPKKKKGKGSFGIDFEEFFRSSKEFGVADFTKHKGISIEDMLKMGKKVFRHLNDTPNSKDKLSDKEKEEQKIEAKTNNEELRKIIEDRKRQELESRQSRPREEKEERAPEVEKKREVSKQQINRILMERGGRGGHDRG